MGLSLVSPLASPSLIGQVWDDYIWLVVVGAIVSFVMAMGIGANDVANAFGTSVGAKTITIFQACLIAMFMEFGGAIALGGEVTRTVAGGIARPSAFAYAPELFAYGMVCALVGASVWVFLATYLCLAVSTTHSIIGAIMGFALVWGGADAVVWNDHDPNFPYSKGLVPIVCSWFVSPISSGLVAGLLFFANRLFILRRRNSTTLAMWSFPVLLLITMFINIFFVLYKGASKELAWDVNKAAWVAACAAAGCFLLGAVVGVPWLRYKLRQRDENEQVKAQAALDAANGKDVENNEASSEEAKEDAPENMSRSRRFLRTVSKAVMHGVNQDIHKGIEDDATVSALHASAEVFDPKTEHVYQYLQVFSACCVSFGHGANDVANAVGPFAGIWAVFRAFTVSSNAASPKWILAMGGAGIVVGLWVYGYNIMQTLGVGMAKMTPSRGFCAELATSFTIVIASAYKLPISTTQCIVGAEVGVGLVESWRTGVNYKLFLKTWAAWAATLAIAGLLSAAFFAQGAYAPSINDQNAILNYEQNLRYVINGMTGALNTQNNYVNNTLGTAFYNRTLATATRYISGNLSNWYKYSVQGYLPSQDLLRVVNQTVALYQQNSVITVGYQTRRVNYTTVATLVPSNITA